MFAFCNVGALFFLAAAGVGEPQLERFQDARFHMGTKFQIIVYAANESAAATALESAFARIGALDDSLSDFKPDSEVSRLSAASPAKRSVNFDVFRVLARAQHISKITDGAFDVTVGPFTKMWRRARRRSPLRLRSCVSGSGERRFSTAWED